MIYNWAIAAPDAHAKNYSLTLHEGRVRLAPLYDVASFLPYSQQTPTWKLRTAMRIGRDYTLRKADRAEAWQRTAEALGLSAEDTVARAADLIQQIPDAVIAAIDALDPRDRAETSVALLARRVSSRCSELRRTFPTRPDHRSSRRDGVSALRASTLVRAVPCDQLLDTSRKTRCRRRLLTRPCPLHPDSPGSRVINRRSRR